MIIIIILGLIMNIIQYFNFDENENKLDPLGLSMKLVSQIFLSLNFVIAKYNMEKTYCSPYEICAWGGLIELILNIIILIIINKLKLTISDIKHPDNFYELFDNYDINDFIVCIVLILIFTFDYIVEYSTCYYLTPFHVLITSIIIEFYSYLKIDGNILINILGICILILIGFMFLIFVEVIELNICKISYNTKKNIGERAERDSFIAENELNNEEDEKDED
jgi:hypothetical protein